MSLIKLIDSIPFGQSAEKGFFLYSRLPAGFFKKLEEENFRQTILYAAEKSAYYRRRFAEKKIDPKQIRRPEDLGDFFTTPEDLRAHAEEMVCERPDTAFETTGTTSKKTKRVYFSRGEVEDAGWAGAVGLWGVGIRREDRISSAFDYSFWVSGPVLQASCKVLGCFHVEAGRLDPEEFYERLSDYRLSCIVGDPSWIVRLSEIAEKRGPWPMKLLIAGGENLTEEARRYVERVWKADFLLSYGQTEAFGALGMESRAKKGYHLNEFHNYFEIVDRDPEGYGELVYTTLNRRIMPLIRYRSGDLTRFLTDSAPGGLPGARIDKLRGRIDEWTVTAMGNIAPWMFEPFFGRISGITRDWQIEVLKDGTKDRILFHVETDGSHPENALREKIFDSLRTAFPEAFRILGMELLKLDVVVHRPGSLRGPRKLKRILDRRDFHA